LEWIFFVCFVICLLNILILINPTNIYYYCNRLGPSGPIDWANNIYMLSRDFSI
jgi:hypothetical protein